ncbi:hypothetical protein D3C76_1223260 [compost metagenome]
MQQRAVELQHLAGFVGNAYHVFQLHVAAFDGRLDHGAGRRGSEHPGQQAFGVLDPVAVGILVGVEALALAIGEADEALPGAFLADKTRGQGQQVVDLHCQQWFAAGAGAGLLADEAAGLPVFGNPCARQYRDPGEQGEVACQRQHHPLGQRADRQAQRVAV